MRKAFGWGFLFLVLTLRAQAAVFHPYSGWKTIETQHFNIHYHRSIEKVAQKAARIFENIYPSHTSKYEWQPWGKTEVVLSDQFDEANGMASILPYNWLLLRVVPPDPESSIGMYDDWLKTLITHEFTHILHLDGGRGIWKAFRYLGLGKLAAPAGLTPTWVKEGAATLEETLGTEGGRGRAGYSEMLIRTAILNNQFLKIDQADGAQWEWPSAKAPYIYGVKFLQYLRDRFGEDKLQKFHRECQKSFFIGAVNTFSKRAFGKNLYTLWREWQRDLKKKYEPWALKLQKEGITESQIYLGGQDSYDIATFSKDTKKLAYVTFNPRRGPILWLKDLESGKKERLARIRATQITFAPDGKSLVYSAVGRYKRYYFYSDLYEVDLTKKHKKAKQITKGERAFDPDFSPDGKKIVFVSGGGGSYQLKIYDIASKNISVLTKETSPYAQFAHPRFSPDGSKIAVIHFKNREGWELCLAGADGKFGGCLTHNGLAIESRPAWNRDGSKILFSSDQDGVSNIYSYDLGSKKMMRLTRVTTGVFQPVIGEHGKLLVKYYHGKGFDIREISPKTEAVGPVMENRVTSSNEKNFVEYKTGKYHAIRQPLLLPRYVAPGLYMLDNGVYVSGTTGSFDPLRWHEWYGGVSYRSDARHLGYFGDYAYKRFLPTFGFGINNLAVDLGTIAFTTGNAYHFYEERIRSYAYTSVPLGTKQAVGLSYFYEDRNAINRILASEAAALNLGIYSGFNFSYVFGDTKAFPASISPVEKGRKLLLNTTVTDATFGSETDNEQRVFFGDYREFIPLGNNFVFATRVAGGISFGDRIIPGTFSLGGSLGEGILAGGASTRYFTLRGLPTSSLVRDRAMLISGEFRIPLVSPQRGIGTTPIFLNNLHMGIFGDYGDAWDGRDLKNRNNFKDFFSDFLLGVGLEVRADFVIGHELPLTGRLGYGIILVSRDRLGNLRDPLVGNKVKNGILILQWGTSF